MSKKRIVEGIVFNNGLIRGISFENEQENISKSIDAVKNVLMKDNNHPRTGLPGKNNKGIDMEILGYYNKRNMMVLMQNEINGQHMNYIKYNARYDHFRDGAIQSPYELSIYGVGYIGDGIYNNAQHAKFSNTHNDMIRRCHSEDPRFKSWGNVEIYTMWYNFQNFAEWCSYNYYEINNEKMCLDKDLIIKNSRTYSPLTCCFLPNRINAMFQPNAINDKKSGLPRGILYRPEKGFKKYEAVCGLGDGASENSVHIGYYYTVDEAFIHYKEYKENVIKIIANDYWYNKGGRFIPQFRRVYDAMMNYIVEIND